MRTTCRRPSKLRKALTILTALRQAVLGAVLLATPMSAELYAQTTDLRQAFGDKQLVLCFQGKGTSLPYDTGVVREAFDRLPALRNNQVIVTGNSSGAILAVYYACYGFNEPSLKFMEYQSQHVDLTAIKKMQDPGALAPKLLRGAKTEISHEELREAIAAALGVTDLRSARTIDDVVRRSKATPRYPLLIIAGNKEVLDNRAGGDPLLAKNWKQFDPRNWSVSWKPEVYEFYKNHPERFAADNPGLRLGKDRYIGKAVTYFVDQTMYDLLSQIPAEERTGDLRLVKTPADLALAILASGSEPSYFDPMPESNPSKLVVDRQPGDLGTSVTRTYCGGMFMTMPAQDIRRMLPSVRVMGTGWCPNPYSVRKLMQAWYLTDLGACDRFNCWWADFQLQPNEEVKQKMMTYRKMTAADEFAIGVSMAREAFDHQHGKPVYVTPAYYDMPAAAAIIPTSGLDHTALDLSTVDHPRLKTMRGLGDLVAK